MSKKQTAEERKAYMREWRRKNIDYVKAYDIKRRPPEVQRSMKLKMSYGLSSNDYNLILKQQNGSCAICGISQSELKGRFKNLCVDHCHTTGKVRGLLCQGCNRGIGLLKDNVSVLEKAASYIKKSLNDPNSL